MGGGGGGQPTGEGGLYQAGCLRFPWSSPTLEHPNPGWPATAAFFHIRAGGELRLSCSRIITYTH